MQPWVGECRVDYSKKYGKSVDLFTRSILLVSSFKMLEWLEYMQVAVQRIWTKYVR